MKGFEFFCPTKIICGKHSLDKLPDELEGHGVAHPLVMTDAGLVKLGVAEKLTRVLDAADVAYDVFDQVPPDSSMDVVNEVAQLYAAKGCDGFVAIGGGSVIDTTKDATLPRPNPGTRLSILALRRTPPRVTVEKLRLRYFGILALSSASGQGEGRR